MAAEICSADGVIPTIGKHVIAENTLAGGNEGIGVDEAADCGVVITGLQVIEPGIGGVVAAAGMGWCLCVTYIFYIIFHA